MSVLMVDDDREILEFYKNALEDYGIKDVDLANDGAEAWAMINNKPYYFVITDLRMPNMDGISLINKIKNDYQGQEPTILVLSGDEELLHGVKRTFESINIISKPITDEGIRELARTLGAGKN